MKLDFKNYNVGDILELYFITSIGKEKVLTMIIQHIPDPGDEEIKGLLNLRTGYYMNDNELRDYGFDNLSEVILKKKQS